MQVDRVLASWLMLNGPRGPIAFATVTVLMGTSTDTPHFNLEVILQPASDKQSAGVTVVIDLTPRRDLVLHSDYLQRVYGETRLNDIFKEVGSVSS